MVRFLSTAAVVAPNHHIESPFAGVSAFTATLNYIRQTLKDWKMLIDLPFLLLEGHLPSTAALFICCSHNVYAHRLKKKKKEKKSVSVLNCLMYSQERCLGNVNTEPPSV